MADQDASATGEGGRTWPGVWAAGLGRRYGALVAVGDLDLEVAAGSVVGLLGPNGAGKTTTMRMLATLLRPTAGQARVAGYDVVTHPIEVRRRLGYLTGDTALYGRLTPRETLVYFGRLHGMSIPAIRRRVDELVDAIGLADFVDRRAQGLSTGEKQRVSIARAIFHDPPVLVLDEPTIGLDILAARDILQLFRDEADGGKAVILSTHILAEVELICDRVVVIHQGRVRAAGTVDALLAQTGTPTLARAFFALVGAGRKGARS